MLNSTPFAGPSKRLMNNFRQTTAFFIVLVLLLCGCAPVSERPAPPVATGELEQALAGLGPKARLELLDERAGAAAEPGERAYYQLLAMELLMEYGRAEEVRQRLKAFNLRALGRHQRHRVDLLQAQLALAEGQAPVALQKLPAFSPDYSLPVQAGLLRTRAIALAKLGYAEDSLKTRLKLDEVLRRMLPEKTAAVEDNHQVIWSTLQTMPPDVLDTLRRENKVLNGWVELALAVKTADSRAARERAIADWQRRFSRHPAAATLGRVLRGDEGAIEYPRHIALLLPLSGRYAGPAGAIRDGFLASYYGHDAARRPQISLIDTGEDTANTHARYQSAVAAGADFVVGPLKKEAVAELAATPRLATPVLALNYAPDAGRSSPQVVQFGLLPEDEARQAAELAIIKNQTRALVFAPNTDYGERLSRAFAERYDALGGKVLALEKYSPETDDHSHPIQRALNTLQSRNRHSILRTVTRQRLEFEPHRRNDVEAVFLIATPRHARNFRTQLKFHNAGEVPLYATSQAYSGTVNPHEDGDLNGLIFSDMPWTLQGEHNSQFKTIRRHWPAELASYPRLYALGLDAYRIIPYLRRLQANPFERFPGLTGSIALDENNRIHRELVWAVFENGRPRALEFTEMEAPQPRRGDLSYLDRQ